ncbi:MAG: alpha/beta fold hydrolase [Pseudochelatococcus sp.]|jgi:poly(3-hydroxyalkanoate) synthetase
MAVEATKHRFRPEPDDARPMSVAPFGLFRLPLLWSALAIDASGWMASTVAKNLTELATGEIAQETPAPPDWTTDHTVTLELEAMTLRSFAPPPDASSRPPGGQATLICTPLASVRPLIADFAPDHSVVASLIGAGVPGLSVIDWRSATGEMRYKSLDSYFCDLNVIVDHLGPPVNLIGLCQGGWMALAYAARFPDKVAKLVLVGAPIDLSARTTRLTTLAERIPLPVIERLVALNHGIVEGARFLRFWAPAGINDDFIFRSLQLAADTPQDARAALAGRFSRWFWSTNDMPGRYFLEVVDRLLKRNGLANGQFTVLGVPVDLARVRAPVFLIAAEQDEVVASEQLFAAERLIGTPAADIRKIVAPSNHLGLFIGANTNRRIWPDVGRWLTGGGK